MLILGKTPNLASSVESGEGRVSLEPAGCQLASAQSHLHAKVAIWGDLPLALQSHTDNPKGTSHFQPVLMSPRALLSTRH